jgi:predicted transcriptional regulator
MLIQGKEGVMSKFRSIKAFKSFETRAKTLDPFDLVALLKKHEGSLSKNEISIKLSANSGQVNDAVAILENKGIVTTQKDASGERVVFR